MSHFEISGRYSSKEQSQKAYLISNIFDVFQIEISGNDFNDEHPQNK